MSKFSGIKVEFNRVPGMARRVRKKVSEIVQKATLVTSEVAVQSINEGNKAGQVYTRNGRLHQASAPGEAPATDYGNLSNSIEPRMVADINGEVAVHSEYGAVLEFGGEKMAKRPFLGPALEKATKDFEKDLRGAIEDASRD